MSTLRYSNPIRGKKRERWYQTVCGAWPQIQKGTEGPSAEGVLVSMNSRVSKFYFKPAFTC
jgi:hypothetical protein